ncbi:MAG: D-alanyl-D-alanine carboxypeptidase family protein [Clostridiales bacterium]|nr:D-alanyl-D-alanine carboxypeptidase family protein [Clostridiales bacterium]
MLLGKVISIVALSAALLDGSMDVAMPDKNIDGRVFLVNRQHALSQYYAPIDLRKTEVYGMSQSMRDEAATALESLFAAAKEAGVPLSSVSGYRSYSKQATIYQRKVANTGSEKEADRLVARAGTSEHQLGLAMDVARKGTSSLNSGFAKTKEGQWVYQNAHRFGFIVRYPEGYEDITGYDYEPWHIRYVGVEYATAIFNSGVPMETYMSGHRLEIYDFLIHQVTNEVLP